MALQNGVLRAVSSSNKSFIKSLINNTFSFLSLWLTKKKEVFMSLAEYSWAPSVGIA